MLRFLKLVHGLDSVLLDGVFQHIADALADSVSCFSISRVCLATAWWTLVFSIAVMIVNGPIVAPLFLFYLYLMNRQMFKDRMMMEITSRHLSEGSMNPLRFDCINRFSRILFAICLVPVTELTVVGQVMYFLHNLIWLVGLYFAACQKNPPKTMWEFAPA